MKVQQDNYLNIRIPKELKEQYKKYCKDNGLNLSQRIRNFIENEMNNK